MEHLGQTSQQDCGGGSVALQKLLRQAVAGDPGIRPDGGSVAFERLRDRLKPQAHADCRDLVVAAVKVDGRALRCASARLKQDKGLCLAALRQNCLGALPFCSSGLRANRAFLLEAIRLDGGALRYASNAQFLEDKELIAAAEHEVRTRKARAAGRRIMEQQRAARLAANG